MNRPIINCIVVNGIAKCSAEDFNKLNEYCDYLEQGVEDIHSELYGLQPKKNRIFTPLVKSLFYFSVYLVGLASFYTIAYNHGFVEGKNHTIELVEEAIDEYIKLHNSN